MTRIISPHRRRSWHQRSELRQFFYNVACAVALGVICGTVVFLAVAVGPQG